MIFSPLQLERVYFSKVSVQAAVIRPSENDEVTLNVNPVIERHLTEKNKWKISLDLTFHAASEGSCRYSGEIGVTGVFEVLDKDLTEDKHLNLVSSYGPAVIFGCARDIVLSITSQSQHGPFVLPLVSFMDQKIMPRGEQKPEISPTLQKSAESRVKH